MLRKKKTVRDQVEDRVEDLLAQADVLRQQVADRAPEVRDSVVANVSHGVGELRQRLPEWRDELLERVPELSEETYGKLPQGVADRLPEDVKPKKKKRFRKVLGLGLIVGAGAAVFATLRGRQTPPPPPYQPAPPPAPAPTPGAPAASTTLDAVDEPTKPV